MSARPRSYRAIVLFLLVMAWSARAAAGPFDSSESAWDSASGDAGSGVPVIATPTPTPLPGINNCTGITLKAEACQDVTQPVVCSNSAEASLCASAKKNVQNLPCPDTNGECFACDYIPAIPSGAPNRVCKKTSEPKPVCGGLFVREESGVKKKFCVEATRACVYGCPL